MSFVSKVTSLIILASSLGLTTAAQAASPDAESGAKQTEVTTAVQELIPVEGRGFILRRPGGEGIALKVNSKDFSDEKLRLLQSVEGSKTRLRLKVTGDTVTAIN